MSTESIADKRAKKNKKGLSTLAPPKKQHIRFDDIEEADDDVHSKKKDDGIITSKESVTNSSNDMHASSCSKKQKKKRKRAAATAPSDDNITSNKQDKIFNGLILALSTDNKQNNSNNNNNNNNNTDDQYNNLKSLKTTLQTTGATISPQVHKRVHYLICTQSAIDNLTQRIRQAIKRNVDIVSVDWVKRCLQENRRVDVTEYVCNGIVREIMVEKEREKKMSSGGKGNNDAEEYDSDIPRDDNEGWSNPVQLDCCCVCHENGDDQCPWCFDCNINVAKKRKKGNDDV